MLKRLLSAALLALAFIAPAHADTVNADVVANCGTPNNTYTAGTKPPATQNTGGQLCTNASVSVSGVTDTVATGSLTSTASVTSATLNSVSSAIVQVTGTWSATIQFEGSTDGTNFFSINAIPVVGGSLVTSATANGQWYVNVSGLQLMRVRASAYSSGTIVVTARNSTGPGLVIISGSLSFANPTIGAAVPATANYIAGNQGGNLTGVAMTSGAINVHTDGTTQPVSGSLTNISGTISLPTGAATSAKQPALGTAGSSSTDVISVQGIASGTALPVSGSVTVTQATAANLKTAADLATVGGSAVSLGAKTQANSIPVTIASDYGTAQGATTSGLLGSGVMCAATTAAPTPSNGTTNLVNCNTTTGGVRTDGSGVTQPVSAASLPLPTGAATSAKQPALGTAGSSSTDVISVQGIASGTAMPVSAASLPLPTGASTSAKQPALGTAGTPSADVISVQGLASGTPLFVRQNDGTNSVNIKASGANAATTDPASVVALSPNPSTVCTSVKPISQTASTDLITSTNKLHICSVVLVSATAQNISLVEGTGTTCATGIAALVGGTTASVAVAANGGFSAVSERAWLLTQTTADHLCLLQSGAGNVSGVITYTDHN